MRYKPMPPFWSVDIKIQKKNTMESLKKKIDLALKEMRSLSSAWDQLKVTFYQQENNPQEQIQKATRSKGQIVQLNAFRKKNRRTK